MKPEDMEEGFWMFYFVYFVFVFVFNVPFVIKLRFSGYSLINKTVRVLVLIQCLIELAKYIYIFLIFWTKKLRFCPTFLLIQYLTKFLQN